MAQTLIDTDHTHVLPLELDKRYPVIVRGVGAWVEDAAGNRYLDAMSGGSMAATLGHGRADLVAAARAQAERLSFVHNERLTNPAQEQLARELVEVAPEGMTRVRFVTSGSDANEMAIQLARSYHVERGEPERWQIVSPAQAYHGPTMETLALTGRPGLQGPFGPYLRQHLHIPPSTWRFDPTGRRRSTRWTRTSRRRAESPRSSARRSAPPRCPATRRPPCSGRAWPNAANGTASWYLRRGRHRHRAQSASGSPGAKTACAPDLIATAKGLGAGYAADRRGARAATASTRRSPSGSRRFTLGHTWDGAPLPARSGSRCCDALRTEGLDRARPRARARGCGTSWRRRWRASRSSARCAGTATCWGVVRRPAERRYVPARPSSASAAQRRRGRFDRGLVRCPPSRRVTAMRRPDAVRAAVHRRRTRNSRRWSTGSPAAVREVGASVDGRLESAPTEAER